MRNVKILTALLLIFLFIGVSCKKEDTSPVPTEAEKARDQFYEIMKNWYLWYDMMPDVNVDDYDSPQTLLEALRYTPTDQWSFITSLESYQSYFEAGQYIGFGLGYSYNVSGDLYVAFVFKDSDLYSQGVRRGWRLSAINGTPVSPFENITSLMGEDVAGISRTLTFIQPDQASVDITVVKDTVTINTVLVADTLHVGNHTVGHLVFQTFIEPALAELDSAFAYFKSTNCDQLIVDLRYNGGGDLDVANKLASLIIDPSFTGQPFISFKHNDIMKAYDSEVDLTNETNSLSLGSVLFITSRNSASASEALISGLKPYASVTQIGDYTYGKPVGMHVWMYDDYVFVPVSFRMVNASGETDYYDGLSPDDVAADGLAYDFSDRREDCLSAAIYYIENGTFPSKKERIVPYMPIPKYTGLRSIIRAL